MEKEKEIDEKVDIFKDDLLGPVMPIKYFLEQQMQNLLWKEFQCDPQFSQSVSFVFLKQIINQPFTDQESKFSKTFRSKYKLIKRMI